MLGSTNHFRPYPNAADKALALDAGQAQANATRIFGDAGTLDSWQRFKTFDMTGMVAPFTIELSVGNPFVSFHPFSHAIAGLAWDDATLKESGPVTVGGGDIEVDTAAPTTRIRVNQVRGQSLEVWTSGFESLADAQLISIAQEIERETQTSTNASKPIVDPQKAAGISAALVTGVVLLILAATLGPALLERMVAK